MDRDSAGRPADPAALDAALVATFFGPTAVLVDAETLTAAAARLIERQGFEVTGVDISALAIERATARAGAAAVAVRFLTADLLADPDLGGPFRFSAAGTTGQKRAS